MNQFDCSSKRKINSCYLSGNQQNTVSMYWNVGLDCAERQVRLRSCCARTSLSLFDHAIRKKTLEPHTSSSSCSCLNTRPWLRAKAASSFSSAVVAFTRRPSQFEAPHVQLPIAEAVDILLVLLDRAPQNDTDARPQFSRTEPLCG